MIKRLLLLFALSVAAVAATDQQTATITTTGQTVTLTDNAGSGLVTFEYDFNGAPATVSVVLYGCMRGGDCNVLNTYTTVANVIQSFTGGYDYYTVSGTFTGGTAPNIVVYKTGIQAKVNGGSGSGVVSINGIAGPFTFTGGGVSCTSTTCTFSGGGSAAFSAITSGTNTTAAMVVGSGATLAASGTGTITATNATTTPNASDSSTAAATNQFVQNAVQLSMATVPLTITGGTYSFDSQGSGATVVVGVSGGAVTSIITWAGGTGYAVGDLITVNAAGSNFDAYIRITAVTSGAPTAGTIVYGGTGYTSFGGFSAAPAISSIPFTFLLSGTLTSNAQLIMTNGTYLTQSNQWIFANNTTGAFTTNICVAGATDACAAGGRTVTIAQGTNNSTSRLLQTDGELNVDSTEAGLLLAGLPFGVINDTAASVASTPAFNMTGTLFTGGTGTTNTPHFYINQGTTPTTWSTAGTEFGINAPSGFTGQLLDFHLNGGASVASINRLGASFFGGAMILGGTGLTPATLGTESIGTAALPFVNLFIGTAATNNIQLTGTSTASRVATFPDATGTVAFTPGVQAFGIATLASGTVTVSNAAACTPSATCVYRLSNCGINGSTAIGVPGVGTVSVGANFVINSYTAIAGVAVDSSKICWSIN